MPRLDRRILEELIYERVRVTVDLCKLVAFEADLRSSIRRALEQCASSPDEREGLAERYLCRAWRRVSREVGDELGDAWETRLGDLSAPEARRSSSEEGTSSRSDSPRASPGRANEPVPRRAAKLVRGRPFHASIT